MMVCSQATLIFSVSFNPFLSTLCVNLESTGFLPFRWVIPCLPSVLTFFTAIPRTKTRELDCYITIQSLPKQGELKSLDGYLSSQASHLLIKTCILLSHYLLLLFPFHIDLEPDLQDRHSLAVRPCPGGAAAAALGVGKGHSPLRVLPLGKEGEQKLGGFLRKGHCCLGPEGWMTVTSCKKVSFQAGDGVMWRQHRRWRTQAERWWAARRWQRGLVLYLRHSLGPC